MFDKNIITIQVYDKIETHLPDAIANYDTLCGLDGNDPHIGTKLLKTPKGAKINCYRCKGIWESMQKYKIDDFK